MPIRGNTFSLTFDILNVNKLKDRTFPPVERFESDWRFRASKMNESFNVFMNREKLRPSKTLQYDIEMFFINPKDHSFLKKTWPARGDQTARLNFDNVVRTYAKDNTLTIRCDITLKYEVDLIMAYDFSIPRRTTDWTIVVEECEFHVSKMFLANFSKYFENMIFGEYEESKKAVIELKKEQADAFQQFLEVAHHEVEINKENVRNVLRLARYYQAEGIMKRCERALLGDLDNCMDRREKLRIADEYQLSELTDHCVRKIKTVEDMKSVAPSNIETLSNETTKKLLQRVLDFTPGCSLPKRTRFH